MKLGAAMMLAIASLAGCAGLSEYDRMAITSLERNPSDSTGQTYIYRARTGSNYPPNDPEAEATRVRWLQTWLTTNKACPDGYEVKSRDAISMGAHPDAMRLTYMIQCK